MKIAVITSGILPVPAVQGGAVENLIDFYLEYNSIHKLHNITVFSVYDKQIPKNSDQSSDINSYYYINTESLFYRFRRKLYSYTRIHKHDIYNYHIEFFFEEVYKILSKQHFDLIILENRPGFSIKLSKRLNTPLVAHIHFDMLNSPKSEDIFEPLVKVITVSDYLHSHAPISIQKKCITVYNGIDISKFKKPNLVERNNLRLQFNLNPQDVVLVYCGRIDPIKGVKELIEALTTIKENSIKLLVIGGLFYGKQEIESSYQKEVKKLSSMLDNRIIFTGFQPYHKIPQYMSLGDIAVIPSLCDDAFPTTTLEAMALGLPIIATNRGGIPEQLRKENAILIDTDNNMISNLANAIRTLARSTAKRETMSQASTIFSQKFTKEIYAKSFFEALLSIRI